MFESILTAISSPSWLWFWELVEFISIIVIGVGCWGESHWSEDNRLPDDPESIMPAEFLARKYRRISGRLVVIGLGIELIAFSFAFIASNREIQGVKADNIASEKHVEELRQKNDALELKLKNWAVDQRVSDISAIMYFTVSGTNDDRIPPYGTTNLVATMELCDNGVEYSHEKPFPRTSPTTAFHELESYEVEWGEIGNTDTRSYSLRFQSAWDWKAMEIGFFGYNNPVTAGQAMNLINGLRVNLKFLPHESRVVSGYVLIIVNNNDPSTTKTFTILPQNAKNDIGAFGVWDGSKGFTLVSTNWK
jgi:hypothetical protein